MPRSDYPVKPDKQFDEQDFELVRMLFMIRFMDTKRGGSYVAKDVLFALQEWERTLSRDESTQDYFDGEGGQIWQGAIRYEE